MLLNTFKDIGLIVSIGKTEYIELGHEGFMPNEHIAVNSNYYKKVKTFKYLFRPFIDKSQLSPVGNRM